MDRYRLQEWLSFLDSEIHKGFIPLLYARLAGIYGVQTAKPKLERRYVAPQGRPQLTVQSGGGQDVVELHHAGPTTIHAQVHPQLVGAGRKGVGRVPT